MKDKINKICTELNDGKIAVVQATEKLFDLYIDSDCYPTDKEVELLSNKHSYDMDLRPDTYHSYKDGMEDCIELIKEKLNNH